MVGKRFQITEFWPLILALVTHGDDAVMLIIQSHLRLSQSIELINQAQLLLVNRCQLGL